MTHPFIESSIAAAASSLVDALEGDSDLSAKTRECMDAALDNLRDVQKLIAVERGLVACREHVDAAHPKLRVIK